ncbi:MAG: CBS domain-containing protein [Planctomycetes bacterium]|nr:CBS domain-containing protein [Planctomycetota bacterium]
MAERVLARVKVREVRDSVVKTPTTVGADCPLKKLLEEIIGNPVTRHAYVVDEKGVLTGSIRLSALLGFMFPYLTREGAVERPVLGFLRDLEAARAEDIMNVNPAYVKDDMTVLDAIRVMVTEGIVEVPVVDDGMRVTGEINFMEIIKAYLLHGDK